MRNDPFAAGLQGNLNRRRAARRNGLDADFVEQGRHQSRGRMERLRTGKRYQERTAVRKSGNRTHEIRLFKDRLTAPEFSIR